MFLSMVFMFCFFIGSLALFLYLCKKLDRIFHSLSDEHAQMRVLLRAMEARLDKISHMEKVSAILQGQMGERQEQEDDKAGHDSLLHLSFEKPRPLEDPIDPGLDLNIEEPTWNLNLSQEKNQE